MNNLKSIKIYGCILAALTVILLMGVSSFAAESWEDMGTLTQATNPLNNQYEKFYWDSASQCYKLYYYPPTSSYYFQKTVSFAQTAQPGYEYKLEWTARCTAGTTFVDGRSLPADGSYSQPYETYGLTLTWDGMSNASIELKNVKLYRKKVHSDWVYQGEIRYNTNPVDSQYEKIKWDNTFQDFYLIYDPPITGSNSFDKELSFTGLQEEGYEYKLVWRAQKGVTGATTLDNRNLPYVSGNWSPQYETRGLKLSWSGIWHLSVRVDYVKLYVRKINPHANAAAYWEFTNGSGDDCSGNNSHGTFLKPVSTMAPGISGQALQLDGTNAMIVPDKPSLHLGNEVSINFWMKTSAMPSGVTQQVVMRKIKEDSGKKNGFEILRIPTCLHLQSYYNDTKVSHTLDMPIPQDGNWHMYTYNFYKAATSEIYYFRCYCDGMEVSASFETVNFLSSCMNTAADLMLGGTKDSLYGFTGMLDEVSLYNRSIIHGEIYSLYKTSGKYSPSYEADTVLKLPFNKSLIDSSGKGNSVSTSNGAILNYSDHNDYYRSGADFDGQNCAKISNSSNLNFGTGDFSVSCWFKSTSTTGIKSILDKRILGKITDNGYSPLGYHLCLYYGTSLVIQLADSTSGWYNYQCKPSGITLNDGKWHFVSVTVDRDNPQGICFYVDGALKGTFNPTNRMGSLDNTADLLVGGHALDSGNNFNGSLDEVALYKRSLTLAEVSEIYGKKKWNLLLYMDGDNNLEKTMLSNIVQIEKDMIGTDINVMVLMDRLPGYDGDLAASNDWTGAKLFKLEKGLQDGYNFFDFYSRCIKDYGEVNMGDPKTLEDFIVYCQTNYPAEHTLLMPSNHGTGLYGMCIDDTNNCDTLELPEVKGAMEAARQKTGQKVDILSMYDCLMQMMETLYQLRNEADYIQGSEETAGVFDINQFVQKLEQQPDAPVETVAGMLDELLYTPAGSCIRMGSSFESFANDFKAFAMLLNAKTDFSDIKSSVDNVFRLSVDSYADLIDFAKRVAANTSDTTLKAYANKLITDYQKCLVWSDTGRGLYGKAAYNGTLPYLGNTNGLSICLASNQLFRYYFYPQYNKSILTTSPLALTQDSLWDEFLTKYYTYIKSITDGLESQQVGQSPSGYTVSGSTVVVDNQNYYLGSKALKLEDTSTSQEVLAGKTGTSTTSKTLECMLYAKNITNGIVISLCSGGNANKVFSIKFLADGSIQYYNGSQWTALAAANKVPLSKWTRIELKAESTTSANLFVDDKCVGTLTNCGSYATMDRFVFSTDSISGTGDLYYIDDVVF